MLGRRGVEEIVYKRKLIEVALPLEAINRESARENYIYRGNPSSVHKWWAQRPLAAARAVLFAQLVDDPSSLVEAFPSEELQRKERERLHRIIERLVVWENAGDDKLLAEAHAEILKSTGGAPPPILDPFAGGGTIPLEAQRLGLQAHASDLNPVAVLINKALIELLPRFRDRPPIFPGLAGSEIREWKGAEGLAADVRAYGGWMRSQAEARIGHHYPMASLPDGSQANVIAWIWARTITCPNPACGIDMPLVRSWWLGKKAGKEAFIVPAVVPDAGHPSGYRVSFSVGQGKEHAPRAATDGTVGRNDATCIACNAVVTKNQIREEGIGGRMGACMTAVAADGHRQRVYLNATEADIAAARTPRPDNAPSTMLAQNSQYMGAPLYGLTSLADLFSDRQLVALTTFSDLVVEARSMVASEGGDGSYADAVATLLGFAVDKLADYGNSLTVWYAKEDRPKNMFAQQTIPMVWDYPEVNPFSSVGGSWERCVQVVSQGCEELRGSTQGFVTQESADSRKYDGMLISTDPPYYNNVPYADLSDFFYGWLRRSLQSVYPELLSTMAAPKAEELVANPYRQGGADGARVFFEEGFRQVFTNARLVAMEDFPITVYYAFRQSDSDASGEASIGWETLLEGMIRSGWEITSTWPLRSERGGRSRDVNSNALASSIVLSLRPRPVGAPATDRRGLIAALEAELPDALRKLQQGQIAPVDLPQAAIGPGMAVFSRYGRVIESDGTTVTVRSALARINEVLDAVLSEQEGDFDPTSRFAIAWYRQHGYGLGKFGDADSLARARNTSVDAMDRDEILASRAGTVQLIKPADLSWEYDALKDTHTSNWEALHHLIKTLERDGIAPAGDFLRSALSRPDGAVDADLLKELGHLLFRVAESNGWTKDALSFNTVVTSWPDILEFARSVKKLTASQGALDFDEEDE
jgi:putative DNA methylase